MPIGKQIVKGGLRLAEEASKAPRMSEALNPHVGKRLYITQADRTALNYPEGLLGGPGYTELAGIDPEKYKDIAWAVQSPGVAKTMVGSMARNSEEAVWANLIGSPEQHRSNKVVFDRIMKQFEKAIQEDKLTPELKEKINARLANMKDPKTGKSFFPEDVDITSPEFNQHAQTFHQRAFIADVLAGRGVGGQKGKIIPYEDIIKETTDPLLLEANTGDIGDRLFSLSGKYEERPELHPAFHYSLSGKKESEAFKPAPQGIVLKEFIKDFTQRTGRMPTYYDLTRGYAPSEKITDQMLEGMYKEGYAKGGEVESITDDPTAYLMNEVNPVETSISSGSEFRKKIGSPSELLKSILGGAYNESKEYKPRALTDIPINAVSEIAGMPIDIASELQTDKIVPIRSDIVLPREMSRLPTKTLPLSSEALKKMTTDIGLTSGEDYPYAQGAVSLLGAPEAKAIAKGVGTVAKEGVKGAGKLAGETLKHGARLIEEGRIPYMVEPRMNIIKDQGGMLVGGEKNLDSELLNMKKTERGGLLGDDGKDPHAVALNNWIDTKVRKYIRNQLGTEADPIRKAIDTGVEHNFQPTLGDTKYYVRNKREQVGKPVEGVAQTDLGKEWEYKADSMFYPKSSKEIKEILNSPMEYTTPDVEARRKASLLRVEQDLPIQNEQDLEALKLIHQIPDEYVYTMSDSNVTERLGLNHVSDVLYEDLMSGKLKPEQLNQMSIEKAIRRTAEYDAQKAKEMEKAHATSIEGMPIPKQYDDGYKWVELKHTDKEKTKQALRSEGEMMGHCVGSYCGEVASGDVKIYSLRSPDGKSHVTIEARPHYNSNQWYEANADLINSDPYLKEIEPNIASGDIDAKYGNDPSTDADYIRMMEREMRKKGIEPIEPAGYMEFHQVKGKQNKRPDEKYQKYISDFIKNNPTKHELVDIKELDNTNIMSTQDIGDTGLVDKDTHNHPEVEKILKMLHPEVFRSDAPNIPKAFSRSEELKYDLFKEAAEDLGRQGKYFVDKDDILNHLREKYLLPKQKAKGGSVNLEQDYKLENLRRRYG